ncbi:MAG: hypothetical protein WDM88_13105 [Galbitalea sp.]
MDERDRGLPVAPPIIAQSRIAWSDPAAGKGLVSAAAVLVAVSITAAIIGCIPALPTYNAVNAGSSFVPLSSQLNNRLGEVVMWVVGVGLVLLVAALWLIALANRHRKRFGQGAMGLMRWVYRMSIIGPVLGVAIFVVSLVISSWAY